jgi:hypothetical protein
MDDDSDFPESRTDEITADGGAAADRSRKLGEYKPTNVPLPAADLKHRRDDPAQKHNSGWTPRTPENIGELNPIPENEPAKARTNPPRSEEVTHSLGGERLSYMLHAFPDILKKREAWARVGSFCSTELVRIACDRAVIIGLCGSAVLPAMRRADDHTKLAPVLCSTARDNKNAFGAISSGSFYSSYGSILPGKPFAETERPSKWRHIQVPYPSSGDIPS